MDFELFIGWDDRERLAWEICQRSILAHTDYAPPMRAISMAPLVEMGLYQRETERRDGRLWDVRSAQPMSTQFSIARFYVPFVSRARWALFVDCDFMFRADVCELLALADPKYAVMVVKHDHRPAELEKMDGQVQRAYERKNWTSCMLWNLSHAGVQRLALGDANAAHRDWLHGLRWLRESEIGELPLAWNWLEGYSDPAIEPKAVHFTRGTPDMKGYHDVAYSAEWFRYMTMKEHLECKPGAFVTA